MKLPLEQVTTSLLNENSPRGGTTPVPNELLDAVMPKLRDTELRLLLVVVRQTLGWQDGADPMKRKEKDWLTQSQLMRRTGRASGAVSHAVDALVRANLIDVLDRWGRPLATPVERRRHLGRLYYRLHQSREVVAHDLKTPKSAHIKAHTTKERRHNNTGEKFYVVDKPADNSLAIRSDRWARASSLLS